MKYGKMYSVTMILIQILYNNFLDTFLKIFNVSFPVKKTQSKQCDKKWLTTGIRTSCNNKRKLYLSYKENNNPKFKKHYKEYCKLLTKVIILAKKSYYNTKLINSTNKAKTTWNIIKTTWNIIKTTTKNQRKSNNMLIMEMEGKLIHNTPPKTCRKI